MVTFAITMWRHPIRFTSAPFTSVPQRLVGFGLSCAPRGNEADYRICEGWVRTPVLFEAICGLMFTQFLDDVWDPSYFPTPFSDCLCHVSFSRYLPL